MHPGDVRFFFARGAADDERGGRVGLMYDDDSHRDGAILRVVLGEDRLRVGPRRQLR